MRLPSFCLWLLALCGMPVDPAEANQSDDGGFGPCDVTVTPEEPCEREEDDIRCPYLFNVPPLTIHLPKQLRELERMVQELQVLKDNVDELRRMCADCTVRQTGRECDRESDSESERMNRNEDGRNCFSADSFREFSPQHGTRRVVSGDRSEGYVGRDAENIVLEEKENNKEGAERRSTAGVIKEEKKADGKQVVDTNGTFSAQREGQDKWATNPGGKKREGETNDRKNDRNGMENSRGDRDLLENGEGSVISGDLKKQEKTDDRTDPPVSPDRTKETKIKTQSKENRSGDVKNTSGECTNKRQEQQVEEWKKEMEEGMTVERGNEKPKQAEGKERERASRKGEVEEKKKETGTGLEITTREEKTQTDGDGGLASSRDTARATFAPEGQRPSTSPGGPRQEPVDSSHGSPAFSGLTSPFPWTHKDLTTASEGIQTTDLSASFMREPGSRRTGRPTAAPVQAGSTSAAPAANFSRVVGPTMATTKATSVASFHHNSTAGKDTSSKTDPQPLPGSKNPKYKKYKINNSHNPGPSADKRTKHDQKQKPFHHKPVTKPRHKDPRLVQGLKPDQRAGDLPADLNLKNPPTQKSIRGNTTDQTLTNIQNSNTPQKPFLPAQSSTSRQRNQPVNVNNPDKQPATEPRPESTEIPNITQNQNILHGGTKGTLGKSASEEQSKLNQNPELNQGLRDFSENTQTAKVTAQPLHQPDTQLLENAVADPPAGTTDLSSAQQVTPSQSQKTSLTPGVNLEPGTMSNPTHLEAETEPRPKLQQTHTEEGPETAQHHQTPRRSSEPATEPKPEAESSNVPLSRPRSHTRPAEMPGATSAERSNTPVALKPVLKTKTDLDPLKMTRPTSDPLKTSQTSTQSPPGSVKPLTGENIHPTETEVRPPSTSTAEPEATSAQKATPLFPLKSGSKPKPELTPPGVASGPLQNSQMNFPPSPGPVKPPNDVSDSLGGTEVSTMKMTTLDPKSSSSQDGQNLPVLHTGPGDSTANPNSRTMSRQRSQTTAAVPSVPMTKSPNGIIPRPLSSVPPSNRAAQPKEAPNVDSNLHHNMEETTKSQIDDSNKMINLVSSSSSPDLRSASPAKPGPEPPAPDVPTDRAHGLRVKINQAAAFFNNSRSAITVVMRDCSDYLLRGQTKSRVYLVTPDLRSKSFPVFCDMELSGGGWTLLQRRQDGSVSFNRSWDQYRSGFGELDGGEFWLGNNRIHLLTRERDMTLRVELEDFDGGKGFAEYSQFRVASERLRYTLTVGGYSGNAGNALRFSKSYDHHHRAFTTPDRDHDRYPSGNCGAYYSSGWWFDACMAANLNGRYYTGRYKGVRDGIYWGTWHNISSEYYPTNDRQSFKSVRMMIRPKGFV
ncbi:unnamed protein product, partial [Tetraodon nigroviridis]